MLIAASAALHALQSSHGAGGGGSGSRSGGGRRRSGTEDSRGLARSVCDPALAAAVLGGGPLDGPRGIDSALSRRSSLCRCSGAAGTILLAVYPIERAGRGSEATGRMAVAFAQDAIWFVRVIARAAGGFAVDAGALQALADDAIARLAGIA
ncbi:MAG TPA: hypothetical protein VGF63_10410 [Solirubrobacteraceae bacterium]